jgi:hypothetical protein
MESCLLKTEAANERVRNFSIYSIIALVVFGVWEIWYLRNFFKSKVGLLGHSFFRN